MLVYSKELNGGTQDVYRFENGFGASVVRHEHSYGGSEGLFELAVIVWDGDNWDLDYETGITGDVEGWLTPKAVKELLTKIEALEPRGETK